MNERFFVQTFEKLIVFLTERTKQMERECRHNFIKLGNYEMAIKFD